MQNPQMHGRREFLRMMGVASGAVALSACTRGKSATSGISGSTAASHPPLEKESGDLQVFDWAGYEVKDLWKPYAAEFPGQKPNWTFITTDEEALAKVRGGFRADFVRPSGGYLKDWADLGVLQTWDPAHLNLDELYPALVQLGQIDGVQYGVPGAWGFSSILYRGDMVDVSEESWNMLFDDRYSGKIMWIDHSAMLVIVGLLKGFPNIWDMSDAELEEAKSYLISKKKLVRSMWVDWTQMYQEFGAGNVWIAYAWPDSLSAMRAEKLDVIYAKPTEGKFSWTGHFLVFKDAPNYYHAHEFVKAWNSKGSGEWLMQNYLLGTSNMTANISMVDPAVIEALQLNDPTALQEPNAHPEQWIPRRSAYQRAWDEVKAS